VYLEPDAPDPVLDAETVLGFARRYLPTADAVTAIDETGGEARAYVVDDRYVLKTQRPHRRRPRTSLSKEVFYLHQIERWAPDLLVPRVLGYGQEESVEYILMTRVPGIALRDVVLEGEPRRAVLVELGQTLARLHALPLPPFEASGLFPGDTDGGDVQARLGLGLRQALEVLESHDEALARDARLQALQGGLLDGAPTDGRRAALHSNPGPEHVFVDPSSLKLQGLIDFGDAYISHPSLDLRRWTAPRDCAAILEGYGSQLEVDDAFRRALRVGHVIALVDTMTRRPARRRAALEDLRALVMAL
jgi:aminoglycoside phosphotransferase (APT) family kinase protein